MKFRQYYSWLLYPSFLLDDASLHFQYNSVLPLLKQVAMI
jgi:hypothetical protein